MLCEVSTKRMGSTARRSPIDTLAYVDTPQEAQTLCCEDSGCTTLGALVA